MANQYGVERGDANFSSVLTAKKVKKRLGLLSGAEAHSLVVADARLKKYGEPMSLPDPEEFARQARRRELARRRGRMSTILTGGSLGSPDAALGG